MQTLLNDQKWGLPSCHWQSYLEQFNVDSLQGFITRRWLTTFIAQLWNTAWDLWRYRNGIVHHQQASASYAKLCNDVQQEYIKGYTFLPPNAHHWIQTPLHQLIQKPMSYLLAWLATVKAIRKCEQNCYQTATFTWNRSKLVQRLQQKTYS